MTLLLSNLLFMHRPCVLSAVTRQLPDIGPLQSYWKVEHGMKELPGNISYFALVRFSTDDSEPAFIYPSCCLCKLPGLTPFPARPKWNMLVKEIQALLGEFSSSRPQACMSPCKGIFPDIKGAT
jgi:hypothetical protein